MRPTTTETAWLVPTDNFADRHIGPRDADVEAMLGLLGYTTLDELSDAVVPSAIRLGRPLALEAPRGEFGLYEELRRLAGRNQVFESFIGLGYHDCITPPVILRNVLENPAWYTQYTPYQAEISQGRLEALLTFQTMVADLTALPLANASLLDEATAAAEAMNMCWALRREAGRNTFVVDSQCHPQTLAVLRTRAEPLGLELLVAEVETLDLLAVGACGLLVQSPDTHGRVRELSAMIAAAHQAGTWVVVATDLLALTLLTPPGEMGADIAVGSTQRFGVPLGFGGPHAAFLASREEFKRQIPGRIVGVSRDEEGRAAYRMALQTREQHIRRDKATSNICTAQVLLAVMAAMYATYHGPAGLRRIARRVAGLTATLEAGLRALGLSPTPGPRFDTLSVTLEDPTMVIARAGERQVNLRQFEDGRTLGVSLNETTTLHGVKRLLAIFGGAAAQTLDVENLSRQVVVEWPEALTRTSDYLTHETFHRYHAEHEMLRYLHRLQERDISLVHSMIPLGSCTMKLNGTTLMEAVTWPEFARLHPFAPAEQAAGYHELFGQLEAWLAEITGLPAVSLQPNSGAQGEYAGLLVIRGWHASRGEGHRDVCLIPTSAHGTNPASAVMAGMRVVPVACDARGNIDVEDLTARAEEHRERLAALMVTYPSTHGVFEEAIRQLCDVIHARGGQVYMDGANMNAQVGLCRPAEIGADVVHLNLHKTFCIPHGGGGPGMGPIAVARHLAPFLPGHPLTTPSSPSSIGPVSAAPWGSAGILPISWAYVAMMGAAGLKRATQVAILNANYMAQRLAGHYPILYTGPGGRVAHEFILDLRPLRERSGITADDIAKRLMDFGLHAPTMSWPVAGTLMVEPTESESREELDRFCEAMIAIREEVRQIELGRSDRENNPLKQAPHTAEVLLAPIWDRPYSREQAAYPLPWVRSAKFWPPVSRIDNAWGDRNLICTCDGMEAYRSSAE